MFSAFNTFAGRTGVWIIQTNWGKTHILQSALAPPIGVNSIKVVQQQYDGPLTDSAREATTRRRRPRRSRGFHLYRETATNRRNLIIFTWRRRAHDRLGTASENRVAYFCSVWLMRRVRSRRVTLCAKKKK